MFSMLLSAVFACFGVATGSVNMPAMLADGMVLQRSPQHAVLWGRSSCESVVVKLEDSERNEEIDMVVSRANPQDGGAWRVELRPMKAGGNYNVNIHGSCGGNGINLRNVTFGDVFMCSGQSNMEFDVVTSFSGKQAINESSSYDIRMLTVARTAAKSPNFDVDVKTEIGWVRSEPESFSKQGFDYPSAVCYYTAREIHEYFDGDVPIGLVMNAWGGQPVERFSSPEAMEDDTCGGIHDLEKGKSFKSQGDSPWYSWFMSFFYTPGDIWNGMISPFSNMRFSSVLWYQGEANAGNPDSYKCSFPAMIADWRKKLGYSPEALPFFFVQLAAFSKESFPRLRDAQMEGLKLPATGFALAIDIGNMQDIHPKNKSEVGRRLSLAMIQTTYGDYETVPSQVGPTIVKASQSGPIIRLEFAEGSTGKKLFMRGTHLCKTCCADSPFVIRMQQEKGIRTPYVIKGRFIEIHTPASIRNAEISVEYNQEPFPECALFTSFPNTLVKELPATPFRVKVDQKSSDQ